MEPFLRSVSNDIITINKPISKIYIVILLFNLISLDTFNFITKYFIKRNTNIPINVSDIFTTFNDNQKIVTIKIFEGEFFFN